MRITLDNYILEIFVEPATLKECQRRQMTHIIIVSWPNTQLIVLWQHIMQCNCFQKLSSYSLHFSYTLIIQAVDKNLHTNLEAIRCYSPVQADAKISYCKHGICLIYLSPAQIVLKTNQLEFCQTCECNVCKCIVSIPNTKIYRFDDC